MTPTQDRTSHARHEPSGVSSLFHALQIRQFKEAFQLIDHDEDGWVNESDLKGIFASIGEHGYFSRMLGVLSRVSGISLSKRIL
jgi:Ca2+-binding EF-hand superfamily protein